MQPVSLLVHELGEEFSVSTTDANGVAQEVVVFRGLRLKCGLDCGKLQGEINGITGRMSYRWEMMYHHRDSLCPKVLASRRL